MSNNKAYQFVLPSRLDDIERNLLIVDRHVKMLEAYRKRHILNHAHEADLDESRALRRALKRAVKYHADALKQLPLF